MSRAKVVSVPEPSDRSLPAKSRIESHFLPYYARVPEGFNRVDDVQLENGRLVIEDRAANGRVVFAASRGLPGNP